MDRDAAAAKELARTTLGRRAFLIGGAGVGLALPLFTATGARAAMAGVPADGKIAFKVLRKGNDIGRHAMTFVQDGDSLTVQIDVRITVRIGPVPVYHYTHHCTEHWTGGRFANLESQTVSNEVKREHVSARRTADGVVVTPTDGMSYTAPMDAAPLTHWNSKVYQGSLFNPQSGKALHETVVSRADDMVKLADGTSIRATRISVKGDGVMDDFYDMDGVWAGLHGRVEDGSYVDYLRL